MTDYILPEELEIILEAESFYASSKELKEITENINKLVASRMTNSYRNALAQLDLIRARL